eukprot:jgi/Chrzof1/9038/Cz03g33250.t1
MQHLNSAKSPVLTTQRQSHKCFLSYGGAPAARRRPVCSVTEHQLTAATDAAQTSTSNSTVSQLTGKIARFAAKKQQFQQIEEKQKALAAYMALPASQYSVLDARKIERIDDSTFKCYVGGMTILNFSVEPVITVSVVVEDKGCTIKLLSCQLQGSKSIEDVNDKFTAQMTNVVRWQPTDDPQLKQIGSDTSIEVVVQVPNWASFLPVSSLESVGSKVMQTTLNVMVPRFLLHLKKDYELWASGDESRRPLGTGQL